MTGSFSMMLRDSFALHLLPSHFSIDDILCILYACLREGKPGGVVRKRRGFPFLSRKLLIVFRMLPEIACISNSLMGSLRRGHCRTFLIMEISTKVPQTFCRISAPFPDAMSTFFCFLCKFLRIFRGISGNIPQKHLR